MFRSRALAYAILGVTEIARRQEGAGVNAAEIAAAYDLPTANCAKILSQLAKARVLRSDRGPQGGYQLARPADKTTLLEIYEAAEGAILATQMPDAPPAIARTLNRAFDAVSDDLRKNMGAVSLAALMKK